MTILQVKKKFNTTPQSVNQVDDDIRTKLMSEQRQPKANPQKKRGMNGELMYYPTRRDRRWWETVPDLKRSKNYINRFYTQKTKSREKNRKGQIRT